MKASELRIGNYVNGAYTITEIGMDGVNLIEGDDYASELYILYNNLKPIPLNEEWLLKFGFEWNGFEYEKGSFLIRNDFLVHNLGGYKIFVGSVHQLQNLYHAICGHELKTKQDDK